MALQILTLDALKAFKEKNDLQYQPITIKAEDTASLPSAKEGTLALVGDKMYYYNGTEWKGVGGEVDTSDKADKTYVDTELAKKADKATVDASLALKANQTDVDSALELKAVKTDVEASLALKSDKTYVDEELGKKQDKIEEAVADDITNLFK